MPSYRRVTIDGEARLLVDEPPAPPKNPPLHALNIAYRAEEEDRRDEAADLVRASTQAMQQVLAGGRPSLRRVQKNLRAPLKG